MTHLHIQRALALVALLAAGHGHHIHHSALVQSVMVIAPVIILGLTHMLIVRVESSDRGKPRSRHYSLSQESSAALAYSVFKPSRLR